MPALPPRTALDDRLERQALQVRCALTPLAPHTVALFVHLGLRLARQQPDQALGIYLRLLRTLIATARDEALPWFWRSLCLEHLPRPLAAARWQLSMHDPLALAAVEAAVERARDDGPLSPEPRRPPA